MYFVINLLYNGLIVGLSMGNNVYNLEDILCWLVENRLVSILGFRVNVVELLMFLRKWKVSILVVECVKL